MRYLQFSHKTISLRDVKIASTSSCTPAAADCLPISDLKLPCSAKWQTNSGVMQPDTSGTNPDTPQANKLQQLIA